MFVTSRCLLVCFLALVPTGGCPLAQSAPLTNVNPHQPIERDSILIRKSLRRPTVTGTPMITRSDEVLRLDRKIPARSTSKTVRVDTIPDPAMENDNPSGGPNGLAYGVIGYTYGPNMDQPITISRTGSTNSGVGNPTVVFPHTGWRGMLSLVTDSFGRRVDCPIGGSQCIPIDLPGANATVDRGNKSPIEPLSWFGSLASNRAEQSEMIYKRNRYFDPNRGQFTQVDPIGLGGGLNLYGFASGDAINFDDPFGLCPWCIGAGIGGVAGAGYTILDNYLSKRPLSADLLRNTLSGALAGASLGSALGVFAGAGAVAVISETTLFEGSRSGLRSTLANGLEGISAGQSENIVRQLGKGAVDNIRITSGAGGSITAAFTRAGRNGYQTLTKIIDEAGRTLHMAQTAYDKSGQVVHGELWK